MLRNIPQCQYTAVSAKDDVFPGCLRHLDGLWESHRQHGRRHAHMR